MWFWKPRGFTPLRQRRRAPRPDPHVVTGVPENHLIRALFEGLAVKNPKTLEPEPGVAERWEISDDGTVYTFFINPNAKWSNGEAITASDYVWSWNRALHPDTGSLYAYMLTPSLIQRPTQSEKSPTSTR